MTAKTADRMMATKTADELRVELEARLVELRRRAGRLTLEIELTAAARDRLAGVPNDGDAVRRRYAARQHAHNGA